MRGHVPEQPVVVLAEGDPPDVPPLGVSELPTAEVPNAGSVLAEPKAKPEPKAKAKAELDGKVMITLSLE